MAQAKTILTCSTFLPQGHLANLGPRKCAYVRAMVIRNKAMTTRESLEKMAAHWISEASAVPPGNSTERGLWEVRAPPVASDPDMQTHA